MQIFNKYGKILPSFPALYLAFVGTAVLRLAYVQGQGVELQAALEQGHDLNFHDFKEPQKGPSAPKHLLLHFHLVCSLVLNVLSSK